MSISAIGTAEEKINLSNFRESMLDHFQVLTAISSPEALELLAREGEVAVVISDQKMPKMSGVELLREVRKNYPKTVPIIISAYSGLAEVHKAIEQGEIYHYCLSKPWDEEFLLNTIRNAVATRNALQSGSDNHGP